MDIPIFFWTFLYVYLGQQHCLEVSNDGSMTLLTDRYDFVNFYSVYEMNKCSSDGRSSQDKSWSYKTAVYIFFDIFGLIWSVQLD